MGIICVPPTMGGVAGILIMEGRVMWGCHGIAMWFTQANTNVGQGYISYFLILLLKIYTYYAFKNVYLLLKRTPVVSSFALARRCQRRFIS